MKLLKFCTVVVLFCAFLVAEVTHASIFRLKNMPEKYAKLEGAILEEDGKSLTIMTEDSIIVRTLDTIEIVERTPEADKAFIEKYATANPKYQEFVKGKGMGAVSSQAKKPAQSDETYLLRNKFQDGEVGYVIITGTIKTQTDMGAMNVPAVSMDMKALMKSEITDVESDIATYKIDMEEGFMTLDIPGRKQTMNLKEMMDQQMEAITYKINRLGEMVNEDGSLNFNFMPTQAGGSMNFANIQQGMIRAFPEKRVGIGDTWSDKQELTLPGSEKPVNVYSLRTLESVKEVDGEKIAEISIQFNIDAKNMEIESPAGPAGDMKINFEEFSVNGKQIMEFNIDQGRAISTKDNQTIAMKMQPPNTGQTMSLKMKQNLDSKIVYSKSEMEELWSQVEVPEETSEASSGAQRKSSHGLVGKSAPPMILPTLEGDEFNLSEQKGKNIVILDFWATWCGPCRMVMPIMEEISNAYKDKGVLLIAVNLRETEEEIRKFLQKQGLDPKVVLDRTGSAAEKYQVEGIPQTVIIGKDGLVKAIHVGAKPNLKSLLSNTLDELLSQ